MKRYVWEVLCDGTVCWSKGMRLTKRQAQGKVNNEKSVHAPLRHHQWTIRRRAVPEGPRP